MIRTYIAYVLSLKIRRVQSSYIQWQNIYYARWHADTSCEQWQDIYNARYVTRIQVINSLCDIQLNRAHKLQTVYSRARIVRTAIELVWTSESSMHGESAYGKVSQRRGRIFQMNFSWYSNWTMSVVFVYDDGMTVTILDAGLLTYTEPNWQLNNLTSVRMSYIYNVQFFVCALSHT